MPELQDYKYSLHKKGDHITIFHLYKWTTGTHPRYSQYVNDDGNFYITRESESGGEKILEFYKPASKTTIDTDWTGNAGLTYGRYDEIF